MSKVALYVPLEAKPGKEKEVAEFLKSALPLVEDEPGTVTWFAIQEGPSSFAIFEPSMTRPAATRISMARSPRR
jgi:hypothetical protein